MEMNRYPNPGVEATGEAMDIIAELSLEKPF
jgi:hypothetical protein